MPPTIREIPKTLTYWHMVWDPRTYRHGEYRTVTLGLDLPHETMLRLVCSGALHIPIVAAYVTSLADTRLQDVAEYLRGFLRRIQSDCQMSSMELAVRQELRGTEFDFPRPSPSLVFVHEFCRMLTRHRPLYDALRCEEFRRLGLGEK